MEAKKTGFYEIHKELGAKLVAFAGFSMPIQYSSIIQEHKRVRQSVGLFDVSHMGEFFVYGENALDFLQKITINDVSKLQVNQIQYSAMCYENGGIVDDLLVYRFANHYMVVVNAANMQKDYDWAFSHLIDGVELVNKSDDYSLLALQGLNSKDVLTKLTDINLEELKYYWLTEGKVADVDIIVSRTGYTGEPGYELCFPVEFSEKIWNALMQAGAEFDIEPIGLAARDSLRLEMKYCLYGNDIDATTNPLEAGLGWITKLDKGEFIGKQAIQQVKEKGVERKLVGLELQEKGFPRHGYKVYKKGKNVGEITSGTVSPMSGKGIAIAYVAVEHAAIGEIVEVEVRNKMLPAAIVKTPFYQK